MCATGLAAYFWPSPFWALPTLTLTASAAAVAIGAINMCANLAGYFGNHFTGWPHSHNAKESTCLLFLAACHFLGGVLVSFVSVPERRIALRQSAPDQVAKS
jgi:ACS family tartrate transporter-like MFS transporter